MSEKIIIDGVNVAECKYYHYKGCTANNFGKCDSTAELYKNCYFKQFKRIEQENKLLKNTLKDKNFVAIVEENEQLKTALEPFEDIYFKGLSYEAIAGLAKKSIRITTEHTKYIHALEDIKEISNNMALTINKRKELIANKINEVLNVEY